MRRGRSPSAAAGAAAEAADRGARARRTRWPARWPRRPANQLLPRTSRTATPKSSAACPTGTSLPGTSSSPRSIALENRAGEKNAMADAIIERVGPEELPVIAHLYNQIFRPPREVESSRRRFRGRYNVLQLVARLDGE